MNENLEIMYHPYDDLSQINQSTILYSDGIEQDFYYSNSDSDITESESFEQLSLSYKDSNDIYDEKMYLKNIQKKQLSSLLPNDVYESILKLLYVGYSCKDIVNCIETIYADQIPLSTDFWKDILGYLPIPSQCIYFSHNEPIFSIPMLFVPYNSSPKFNLFYITLRITPFEDIFPSISTSPNSSYTQMDCFEDPDYEKLANQILSITSSIFEIIPFSELTRIDLDIENKEKMYYDFFISALKNQHYQIYDIVLKIAEKYGLIGPRIETISFDYLF